MSMMMQIGNKVQPHNKYLQKKNNQKYFTRFKLDKPKRIKDPIKDEIKEPHIPNKELRRA